MRTVGSRYYPQDLQNLIDFIRTNCTSEGAEAKIVKKAAPVFSSFCQKKPATSTFSSQTHKAGETNEPKICVVQGVPECLKIVSSMRAQLNRDFNAMLEQALVEMPGKKRPLLIFVFSDPVERSKSFLFKIFSKTILENPKTEQLTLNPVTEKNIGNVLESIAANQGIYETKLSKQQLHEIRDTCNKDLRNAI